MAHKKPASMAHKRPARDEFGNSGRLREKLQVPRSNDMGSTPSSPERDDARRDGHQDTMDAVDYETDVEGNVEKVLAESIAGSGAGADMDRDDRMAALEPSGMPDNVPPKEEKDAILEMINQRGFALFLRVMMAVRESKSGEMCELRNIATLHPNRGGRKRPLGSLKQLRQQSSKIKGTKEFLDFKSGCLNLE